MADTTQVAAPVPSRRDDVPAGYTIADLLDAVRADWRVVLAIVATFVIAATAFAFLSPKIYRGETVVLPVSQEQGGGLADLAGRFGGLASLAGVSLPTNSGRDETLALLESKSFVAAFIADNQLMPVLLYRDWDESAQRWKDPDDPPSEADAVKFFLEKVLSVKEDPGTSLVRVRIDWHDRALATQWANELVRRINEAARGRAVERANRSTEYLNRELPKVQLVEMREVLNRLLEAQVRTVMVANVTDEYVLKVVDPAVEPDRDDYVRPQRALLIAVGLLLGIAVAAFYVILRLAQRR